MILPVLPHASRPSLSRPLTSLPLIVSFRPAMPHFSVQSIMIVAIIIGSSSGQG